MAIFRKPVGAVNPKNLPYHSLYEMIDILRPAMAGIANKIHSTHGPISTELFANPVMDCIQLIIRDGKGRAYAHPRYIEQREIVDGSWIGVIEDRFMSTLLGIPSNKPGTPSMVEPAFTLNELEEAEKMMESLK